MAIGTKAQTIPPTKAQTASSPRPSPPKTVRTAVWRWLKRTGLERCELVRDTAGWTMRGTIVTLGERGPAEASYTISCDPEWRTERADISLRDDSGARALGLVATSGRWFENGQENKSVAGCVDIDLGWSPSTNTIAIRRLNLRVGARSGPLTMAWVRFPDLRVGPLAQEYERLEERRYRYTSRGGAFSAVIEVDDDGLVVEYEGFWQRARETR
jgi:hypothetical protein